MSAPKILLVDGPNVVMRAAFGGDVPPDRAVQVATGLLARAILAVAPTHAIVAFDHPSPSWRRLEYADYKAHRTTDTAPYILAACAEWESRGYFTVAAAGFEADDVLATLAHRLAARTEVAVLSNDSDLLALCALPGVRAVRFSSGGAGGVDVLNAGDVAAKYELAHVRQLADYKALVGETGDNVPGVPGIGPKKAAALLRAYGSLEAILTGGSAADFPHPVALQKDALKVRVAAALARQALRLVTLRTDAPVPAIAPATCKLGATTKAGDAA